MDKQSRSNLKCTDKDLKQLKTACLLSVEEYGNQDGKDILAVIARLEAAESLLCAVGGVLHLVYARYKHELNFEVRLAVEKGIAGIKEWRKAAGK